jgi:hypothetical protein
MPTMIAGKTTKRPRRKKPAAAFGPFSTWIATPSSGRPIRGNNETGGSP